MLWSPAGPFPLLFLRPPEHSSFHTVPSRPPTLVLKHMRVGGGFHSQAEGPALEHVGAPARMAHQASCVLDCL